MQTRPKQVAHAHAAQFRGRFMEFVSRSLTSTIQIADIDGG